MTHSGEARFTLLSIEAGLTVVAVALAFLVPNWASSLWDRVERAFRPIVQRKALVVAAAAAVMLIARLAILPWFPAPHPFINDDFSFLLAADTFAHGRLTNPTPAMWTHLESDQLTMQPTYMSQYFPGPGLMMAAGKVLFGHPWAGVLMVSVAMCAGVCWMIQGWLPAGWALLGAVVLILRFGLFSYWSNSYSGGAPPCVLGGALVLGALPRLLRRGMLRDFVLLGVGACLLLITRPYEGFLLCLPVVLTLGYRLLIKQEADLPRGMVLRRSLAPALMVVVVLGWLGFYNYRAFGKPTVLPYTVARATYAVAPYYIWQKQRPAPVYRHDIMRRFYTEQEIEGTAGMHTAKGFVRLNLNKVLVALFTFCGAALLPLLGMMGRVFRDKRIRLIAWYVPVWVAGLAIGVFLIPHYLAPFTAAIYVLGLQAMRHMRLWRPEGKPVGKAMASLLVMVLCVMTALRMVAQPLHIAPPEFPFGIWLNNWIGPSQFGAERASVEARLGALPGKHLVLVRYSATHYPADEWVYNGADVETTKTVWARDMDDASNKELFSHYADRDVWLVQPDVKDGVLEAYALRASAK